MASLPWIEKYRPKTIEEVSAQNEVITFLRASLAQENLPHLLFYGPPGTGKTSTILAFARDIFGADAKQRVLELNASDERGISVVREKIKTFAKAAVSHNSKIPPFKIIVLDEADSMTSDAQSALRRTMEQHSKITRFCLVCNYVSKIIDPLASRCAKFRFTSLPETEMTSKLNSIAVKENLRLSPEALPMLIKVAQGDMRRAIMYLQSSSHLGQEVNSDVISQIAGLVPDKLIRELVAQWKAKSFDGIQRSVNNLIKEGYAGFQIVDQLFDAIMADVGVSDLDKSKVALRFMMADRRMNDGCDEELQLMRLVY